MSIPINKKIVTRCFLMILILVLVFFASMTVIVNENEKAILTRFGKPYKTVETSGMVLHWPSPIDKVILIDTRLQHGEIRVSESLTADKRNVIIPIFFSWRVGDVLKYSNNVESVEDANSKLNSLITSSRNSVLGRMSFDEILNVEGDEKGLRSLEREMFEMVADDAMNHIGVDLVTVGVTAIRLPKGNTEAVFRRMRSERKREASAYRAEGKAKSDEIKTLADTKSQSLIAQARRYAEERRGEAEAEAARIYTDAHAKNPSFYRFMRRLQSLRTVVDKNTTMVLDTKSPPFDLLKLRSPLEAKHLQGINPMAHKGIYPTDSKAVKVDPKSSKKVKYSRGVEVDKGSPLWRGLPLLDKRREQ